ncbi:SOS response-associated peptidase [Euzebya tangerina]|uniref:SOS response-associated peptidase n=1 Tax=Euzebya tangerina TaxID=591198 RepID=UPI000E324291|nr:SOS response-associated peptidase [Euzebya tangerina]
MCGRYVATEDADGLLKMFVVDERDPRAKDSRSHWDGAPNYNVAPTDSVPAIVLHEGHRVLTSFRWGLVPFWAKDAKIGARMINARSETIEEKSAFAQSFERRRCLLPADGFYEWQKASGKKLPWFVRRTDGRPMVFAGIWASWRPKDEPDTDRLLTCAILTTDANQVLAPIHDRMPVVIEEADFDLWLDPQADEADLKRLLRPSPDAAVERFRVSTRANSVANNDPSLLEPVDEANDEDIVGPGHPAITPSTHDIDAAEQPSLFSD